MKPYKSKGGIRNICPYKTGKYSHIEVGTKYCKKCWMNNGWDSVSKEIMCGYEEKYGRKQDR